MSEIIHYLNSPHLVASFQKIFGVEPEFNSSVSSLDDHDDAVSSANVSSVSSTESDSLKHSPVKNQQLSNNQTKSKSIRNRSKREPLTNIETIGPTSNTNTQEHSDTNKHKRNSSNVKVLVNNTDHCNIVANTTIHNQFWFYLFHLGAAMGNEIFYCLFFPFWFWNVDSAIGRKVNK